MYFVAFYDYLLIYPWRQVLQAVPVSLVLLLPSPHLFPQAPAKLLQSCPTLCDPIDGSPPGSTIPGILQARLNVHWKD